MKLEQTPTSFLTVSGRYIDTLNFKVEDVNAWDIAWALSKTIRYGGHIIENYSVLDHSWFTYQNALNDKGRLNAIDSTALLLHDAAEYAIGDIIRPVKAQFPAICDLETNILKVIFQAFDVDWNKVDWDLIHEYDNKTLWTEQYILNRGMDVFHGNPGFKPLAEELWYTSPYTWVERLKSTDFRIGAAYKKLYAVPDKLQGFV